MKQMFAATHYSMSLEDPESGTPPEAYAVSDDRQRLVDYIIADMQDMTAYTPGGTEEPTYADVKVEQHDEATHILASFPGNPENFSTYYIVEPVRFI